MTKESLMNVPMKPAVRKWLDRRASRNGRASSREAQAIIEDVRKRESEENRR